MQPRSLVWSVITVGLVLNVQCATLSQAKVVQSPRILSDDVEDTSQGIRTNYSSMLNSGSATFTRPNAYGIYYYEAIEVEVTLSDEYTFISEGTNDPFCYLFVNRINSNDLGVNQRAADDDSGGQLQCQFTVDLEAGVTYIFIFTTYAPESHMPLNLIVWGPAAVAMRRIFLNLTTNVPSSFTDRPIVSTTQPGVVSYYSSILNRESATFTRPFAYGVYTYEALGLDVALSGEYTFMSNGTDDPYCYLYENSINRDNLDVNQRAADDDSGGQLQCRFTVDLEAGTTYIFIFTTYAPESHMPLNLIVWGPTLLHFNLLTLSLGTIPPEIASTAASPSPVTGSPGCLMDHSVHSCPGPISTNNNVLTVDPPNRPVTNGTLSPNKIYFNLEDSMAMSGYLQSVTVYYGPMRSPTNNASIWIYGIVAMAGSYAVCSGYLVPASPMRGRQIMRTYMIPDNTIYVSNGLYIGIGISDTLGFLLSTTDGSAMQRDGVDTLERIGTQNPVYFTPVQSRVGVKLTYTIVT